MIFRLFLYLSSITTIISAFGCHKASGIVGKRQLRVLSKTPSIAWRNPVARGVPLHKFQKPKAQAANTFWGNEIDAPDSNQVIRRAHQDVYFWPSLTAYERELLRDAFFQLQRRTCLKFDQLDYKPWYHADRWDSEKPYILVRKSQKYAAYSDNTVEGTVGRTLLYISESAFLMPSYNHSRGAIMDQLVRFMGLKREIYRPDAPSYIQPIEDIQLTHQPQFHPVQLEWPFDPESITVPLWAREKFQLTEYCPARNNGDIGAGQRVGLLTRWDTIKLNSMYCSARVVEDADPHRGPCVIPRRKDLDEFRRRAWLYKRMHNRRRRQF
ncbi:unnamed protein product, partial [Mesorhabditis belari]|uniref:Uncharacterized protein n=1 Tax=Mesorhabditis belari TaxID=2138241 RepID=A0AAF3F505_9BILA